MKPIIFHPDAETELDRAVARYQAQKSGLGLDLQSEIEEALKLVQQLPNMCPLYKKTSFRKCVVRRFPYTIFYRELDDRIWVVAVAHQKRKPGYWTKRTPD